MSKFYTKVSYKSLSTIKDPFLSCEYLVRFSKNILRPLIRHVDFKIHYNQWHLYTVLSYTTACRKQRSSKSVKTQKRDGAT